MEEGELEVFYRSSEIRTLVKTRSMQLLQRTRNAR